MRGLEIFLVLALASACNSKPDTAPAQTGTIRPTQPDESGKGGHSSSRRGKRERGHPAEIFAKGDTAGRLIARGEGAIYWIERRATGSFVVGQKTSEDRHRLELAGPLAPIHSIAANRDEVFVSAAPLPGTVSETLSEGTFRIRSGNSIEKISDHPGLLAYGDDALFVLYRGHKNEPGRIVRLADEAKTIATVPGGLGRANLIVRGIRVFWLGDKRELVEGIKVRTGFIQSAADGSNEPQTLASGFSSPGTQLLEHRSQLYFTATTEEGRRRLFRVPAAGGSPVPLLGPSWEVSRVAIDDSGIYALARERDWQIVKFAGDSFVSSVLNRPKVGILSDLILDQTHIYWGHTGAIKRVPKTAPSPKTEDQ